MRYPFIRAGLRTLLTAFLLLGAVPALAQDGPDRERRGWRGRFGGEWMDRMRQRLADTLELDELQAMMLDEIAASRRERWQGMREMRQQIREAEENGDEALSEELRGQLPERLEGRRRNPMAGLLDEIEPHLRSDQLNRLEELREETASPQERMERLAEQLDLDEQQRPVFDGIADDTRERFREQGRRMRDMRSVFRQIRQAREAGDDETADELRLQVTEARGQFGTIIDDFFTEVEPILRDDQIEILDGARRQMAERRERFAQERSFGGRGGPGGGEWGDRGRNRSRGDAAEPGGAAIASEGVLNRIEEALDFSDSVELNADQREAFDEAVQAGRAELERGELSDKQTAELFKEVRASLEPRQREAFDQMLDGVLAMSARRVHADDLRLVLSAARRLKLDKEQERQLREIQKSAAKAYKSVRQDRDKRAELAEETKGQIVEMLNDRQIRRFERNLQRLRKQTRAQRSHRTARAR